MSVSDWARLHGADEPIEGEVEQDGDVRPAPPPLRPRAEFFRQPRDVTPPERQPAFSWWKTEQAKRYSEMGRYGKTARDRFIGLVVWFGLSLVLPGIWKYFAWWIAVAMGVNAIWNAEHWLMARRQAHVQLRDVSED